MIGGITPREVMEIIFQPTIFAGMPRGLKGACSLEKTPAQQGCVAEITETRLPQRLPE